MINDLIKQNANYDFVLVFVPKSEMLTLTDQDKKHIRIMAILRLAKDGQIDKILNVNFTESFSIDTEHKVVLYKIKIIRERKKHYADA